MGKPDLWQRVREQVLQENETVLCQFLAMKRPPLLLSVLLGGFSGFLLKQYVITLTGKNIYFTPLNSLTVKPEAGDVFAHSEIMEFTHQKGFLKHWLFFRFTNGNALKLSAYMRKEKEGFFSEEKLALLKQYLAS